MLIQAFDISQSVVDINETAKKYAEIIASGCNSVPKFYGTGKK